jgi:hypothetical protein
MAASWVVHIEAGVNNFTLTTGANPRLVAFNVAGDAYWLNDDVVIASG